MKKDKILYLVADFSYEKEILEALRAGIDVIQLREKHISSREYLQRANILREWTREYPTAFIVNDRIDIAWLSDADGVHLGQDDVPADQARQLLGAEKIIGVTVKTEEAALAARNMKADYMGCGAWFASTTKKEALPIGADAYHQIKALAGIPDVAIGGITVDNCEYPLLEGASGLAVSAGILGSSDIAQTIREFRKKMALY